MNHRLKLRLQALTEEGGDPQGPVAGSDRPAKVAELTNPTPPVVAPVPKQSWLMELLSLRRSISP